MSEHYHDAADVRLLREMRKLAPTEYRGLVRPQQHRRAGRGNSEEVPGADCRGRCVHDPVPGLHRGTCERGEGGRGEPGGARRGVVPGSGAARRRCRDARRDGAQVLRSVDFPLSKPLRNSEKVNSVTSALRPHSLVHWRQQVTPCREARTASSQRWTTWCMRRRTWKWASSGSKSCWACGRSGRSAPGPRNQKCPDRPRFLHVHRDHRSGPGSAKAAWTLRFGLDDLRGAPPRCGWVAKGIELESVRRTGRARPGSRLVT